MLIKGKTSLSSLVGMGSKRQVDGLHEGIITAVSKVPVFVDKLVPVEGRDC